MPKVGPTCSPACIGEASDGGDEVGQTVIELVVSWLPLLIFFGLFLLLMQRSRRHYADVMAVNKEILARNQRMVDLLEEISAELKQRKV